MDASTKVATGAVLVLLACVAAPSAFAANDVSKAAATLMPTNEPDVFAYSQPAPGFDPLTATDQELALAGFPPRPDPAQAPEGHARWKKMVTAGQERIERPQLQHTTLENRPVASVRERANAAPGTPSNSVYVYSGNWSGFAVAGPYGTFSGNNSFTLSEFVVPQVQQAFGVCNGTWDYSSIWTGFDGWGSGDVLQAGIEADAYCLNFGFGQSKSTFYSAWFEWYPNGSVRIGNLPVSPGNVITVEVWYTTSAPNGHAYIINYDAQKSVSLAFSVPNGTAYAGNSVEWVVEAPTVSGSLATLSNYIVAPANFNYAYNGRNYFYPATVPAGTTSYDITMKPGTVPISTCLLAGVYTLWCEDEGTAY
jgi:hypothetical protein